jgi:hypothetical protein
MAIDKRVTTTDFDLARQYGDDVHLGSSFLFLGPKALTRPPFAWVTRLLGGGLAGRPQVVSLWGQEAVQLPGVRVGVRLPEGLRLASVTCDKAVYREVRDEVRLLVVDLLGPGTEQSLELSINGQSFGRYPVQLDGRGAAALALRDLPAGDYEARLRGAPAAEPPCSFTMAVYRLAPLVAQLVHRQLDGDSKLSVRVRLETFGVPVEGEVSLELMDRGRRVSAQRARSSAGLLEASLTLSGEGPHSINVQLVSDPGRTASLPIVGSRAFEREQTIFSTLGTEVRGALLPGEGAREVRGVFLEEGASRTSPVELERVDSKVARLRARAPIESLRLVAFDLSAPRPRADAINVATAPHPANADQAYVRAEKLFQAGRYVEARALFELTLSASPVAHPNYAYYVACCHAKEGRLGAAVATLRTAIEHGWTDLAHLATDDDLASLRGLPAFEALRGGGLVERSFEGLFAGQTVEIEAPGPVNLLAVGAFVDGKAWEGWSALLAPSAVEARVVVPELPTPHSQVNVDVETGTTADASVYVIIKDARLLSADTPSNRLAGHIKRSVEAASKSLHTGEVSTRLGESLIQYAPAPPTFGGAPPRPGSGGPTLPPMAGMGPPPVQSRSVVLSAARPVSPGMPPVPRSPAMLSAAPVAESRAATGYAAPGAAPYAPPQGAPAAFEEEREEAEEGAADAGPARGGSRSAVTEEPEILFAGLVEAPNGQARVAVTLGPQAGEYLIEAFVLSGLDWKATEARFRAEKLPLIELEVPPFVHPTDAALGRLTALASSDRMTLRLLRDGVEVPLSHEGRTLAPGEVIRASRVELSFLVGPGDWSAVIEDATTGAADWTSRRVDEPGKLRRLARSVRLLEPGQSVSRGAGVVGLRVLPGLDRPFEALVDATADYGHACCEQTAAKILSACGMYALARDGARRSRAESIILAGVRRERTMWLRGRGFKMYPESSDSPDTYWGPKAARYLWNLSLLRDIGRPSPLLAQAIDEGLEMAADACRAYRIAWPLSTATTCEEAYLVARFSLDRAAVERAVQLARGTVGITGQQGVVLARAEAAYAAATLLRAGGRALLPQALALANLVTQQFNALGRLYSTVDSVAAIAMMAELQAAGVIGSAAQIEIDGRATSMAAALQIEGKIGAVRAIAAVAAVEVTRIVEEDWTSFAMSVPLRVSLERQGRPGRRFTVGDPIELRVKLEQGYKAGDLLWVCLPDALSRVIGGGQVKSFSVDFEGKDEIVVPLAATGLSVDHGGKTGPQHFAVCVRNMFEEERVGSPGLLDVTIEPAAGGSGLERLLRGARSLFGG